MTNQTFSSIYNLCIKADGAFVSEKQANFFVSKYHKLEIVESQSFSFGEFNGCTRSIAWITVFDATGIVSVTKSTAKKSEQYFVRGQVNKFLETKIAKEISLETNNSIEVQRQLDNHKQNIITHQSGLDKLVEEHNIVLISLENLPDTVDKTKIIKLVTESFEEKIVPWKSNIANSIKFIQENSNDR